MSRQISIDPVTRIEGHASVTINVDDNNNISGALFKVLDFRGFETFLQDMHVEMMPTITARICGTCPVTHHLAASKAVDKVFGAEAPYTAELLRNILNLGSIISSHSVHFFALAGPDLVLGLSSPPEERNIMGMVKKHPDLSKKALRLRTIGQLIVETVGGRGTHPVTSVAGGMAAPLGNKKAEKLKELVKEGLALGKELYAISVSLIYKNTHILESLPLESSYLGTVNNETLDLYKGDLRFLKHDGSKIDFNAEEWAGKLSEEAVDCSYGKRVYFNTGSEKLSYRVGPLARLNCAEKIETELANAELQKFKEKGGSPCHQTVMYHHARMIELLYAIEKLSLLVNDNELLSEDIKGKLNSPTNAIAHIEAPRGTLIHDYKVNGEGIVTQANLMVATQQNLEAINKTIAMSAQKFIDEPDDVLLNSIEFGIRCYDPCLSCATHRIGDMKLNVTIRQQGKTVRRVWR